MGNVTENKLDVVTLYLEETFKFKKHPSFKECLYDLNDWGDDDCDIKISYYFDNIDSYDEIVEDIELYFKENSWDVYDYIIDNFDVEFIVLVKMTVIDKIYEKLSIAKKFKLI